MNKLMVVFFIFFKISLFSNELEFSFISFLSKDWKIVVCKDNECKTIKTEQEPRTYDYNFKNQDVVYVASDKSVRLISNFKEKKILESQKDAYTQPQFINDGKNIMLVQLIDGSSKKTKVISINLKGKIEQTFINQYSTALEPYTYDTQHIYYANVSCVNGCGKIIQEIWSKDIASEVANQLTLLNTLSHQPVVDSEGEFLYFSSLSNGNYHIWRYSLKDKSIKQLTTGITTDGFPAAYDKGILFIRRLGNDTKLMKLDKKLNLTEISLSKKYKKIRNLKVKQ